MDMKDMSMASSRIYLGNLSDSVDSDKLFEHFASYGKILGIKRPMKKSYAFIQFDSDESANEAIKNENQKSYHGRTLIVRAAVAGHNATGNKSKETPQTENETAAVNDTNTTTQSQPLIETLPERNERAPVATPRGFRGDRDRDRYPPPRPRSGFRSRSSDLDIDRNDWPDRGGYDDRYPANDIYPVVPERNDCEIIVVSKLLTEYAEYIEDRLKRIGLTVDLLFPNEDVPIGRVLGNISSRGSLYALLIMPQNEEHRSLTLNILHGLPQEHRNMPLEDALSLMGRNYAELQRYGSTAGNEAVIALLNQLVNGRSLTVVQYDRVLQYVKECRDKQVKVELGDAATNTNSDKTQVDLQQRILSILNNPDANNAQRTIPPLIPSLLSHSDSEKGDGMNYDNPTLRSTLDLREKIVSMLNTTASQGPVPQPVAAPNLKTSISNPTIQKALDSLLNKMN